MNDMIYGIKQDCGRYKHRASIRPIERFRMVLFNRGLKAMMAYRLRHSLNGKTSKIILRPFKWPVLAMLNIICFAVRVLYGIHVHNKACIGAGLYIGHFGGISIGRCKIGENCSIGHQVRIGSMKSSSPKKGPIVGSHVWIGPHVQIMGDVVIEDHVTIASGSVVTSDVKKNTLVMGNPARAVRHNYDNNYLL